MVDYPTYMRNVHQHWLDGSNSIGTGGLEAAITSAIASNPFTSLTGYDPTTDIAAMLAAITTFKGYVDAMNPHTDYDTYYTAAAAAVDATISPSTYIANKVIEHTAIIDNDLLTKVYPRFEAGMRDINAVMSSAFAIGRAIIEADALDKVDKFAADLEFNADAKRGDFINQAASEMVRMDLQQLEFYRVIMAMTIDEKRLGIAAQQDFKTETKAIEADEGRWPLEVYKYGANMLAGISGGTTGSTPVDGNKTARIIGSGLSGAAVGAQIGASMGGNGGGWGAAIGGIAGVLAGM